MFEIKLKIAEIASKLVQKFVNFCSHTIHIFISLIDWAYSSLFREQQPTHAVLGFQDLCFSIDIQTLVHDP